MCVLFTYLTSELATNSIARLLSSSSDVTLLLLGKKKSSTVENLSACDLACQT